MKYRCHEGLIAGDKFISIECSRGGFSKDDQIFTRTIPFDANLELFCEYLENGLEELSKKVEIIDKLDEVK